MKYKNSEITELADEYLMLRDNTFQIKNSQHLTPAEKKELLENINSEKNLIIQEIQNRQVSLLDFTRIIDKTPFSTGSEKNKPHKFSYTKTRKILPMNTPEIPKISNLEPHSDLEKDNTSDYLELMATKQPQNFLEFNANASPESSNSQNRDEKRNPENAIHPSTKHPAIRFLEYICCYKSNKDNSR